MHVIFPTDRGAVYCGCGKRKSHDLCKALAEQEA